MSHHTTEAERCAFLVGRAPFDASFGGDMRREGMVCRWCAHVRWAEAVELGASRRTDPDR
jgi:hypothetical protein